MRRVDEKRLNKALLKTLLFFDALGESADLSNIERFLVQYQAGRDDIIKALENLEFQKLIRKEDGRYMMYGRTEMKGHRDEEFINKKNGLRMRLLISLPGVRGLIQLPALDQEQQFLLAITDESSPLMNRIRTALASIILAGTDFRMLSSAGIPIFREPDIFQSYLLAGSKCLYGIEIYERYLFLNQGFMSIFKNNNLRIKEPLSNFPWFKRSSKSEKYRISNSAFYGNHAETLGVDRFKNAILERSTYFRQWILPQLGKQERLNRIV